MTVFAGDVGTKLVCQMQLDTSDAAANYPVVKLKKPDASFLQRDYGGGNTNLLRLTMTDVPNGTGNITFATGELVAGVWTGQTLVNWVTGSGGSYGETFTFTIVAILA